MSVLGLLGNISEFRHAVGFVLKNEGGLSENENDPGGITNFGISLRFLKSLNVEQLNIYGFINGANEEAVKEMSLEQAKKIYFGEFWEGRSFGELSEQRICNYVFDMCVNMGHGQGIKLLQRACWALTGKMGIVKDDGILGEMTIALVNAYGMDVLPVLRGSRAEFYRRFGKAAFLNGWLKRTYGEV